MKMYRANSVQLKWTNAEPNERISTFEQYQARITQRDDVGNAYIANIIYGGESYWVGCFDGIQDAQKKCRHWIVTHLERKGLIKAKNDADYEDEDTTN